MVRAIVAASVLLAMTACGEPPASTATAKDGPSSVSASEYARSDNSTSSPELGGGLTGDWERLGPDGFIELRMGMTRQEALATGRIRVGESANGCTGFYLAMYGDGSGLGPHGYFSEDGLAIVHAQGGMHTPEGVVLGTSMDELQRTYPALRRSDGFWVVPASDEADYFFVIEDEAVNFFGLASSDDPCLAAAFE